MHTRRRAATIIAASMLVVAGSGLAATTATASGEPTEIGVAIGFTDYRLDWSTR